MTIGRMILIAKLLTLWCSICGAAELREVVVRIRNQESGGVSSLGSGVVVALPDGRRAVLSCWHTFRDRIGRVTIYTADGQSLPARVVLKDPAADLSLLEAEGLPEAARVADADPQPSADAWAAGYGPTGQYRQYHGRVIRYASAQHDGGASAATMVMGGVARSGDSGGPIFNERGEVAAVLWGTDNTSTTNGTPARLIRRLLSYSRERQCIEGSCAPRPYYRPDGSGRVGIGVEWNRPPAGYAPAPPQVARPTAPQQDQVAEAPPLRPVAPPCKSCECDNAGMKAEIAALKLTINELQQNVALIEARPEPLQVTAGDIEQALKRQPIRAQIVAPDGKVMSQAQTYLGGEPLKFQLRPREVVKK